LNNLRESINFASVFITMKSDYNQNPTSTIKIDEGTIYCFETNIQDKNIDEKVVDSFGEEWLKFNTFSDEEILNAGNQYFDIIDSTIVNKDSYCIDFGCGTGRWSKYLSSKVGFIEGIDPSNAILAAHKLLNKQQNIRLSKASIDNIPFDDNTFDFGMSIGVLHHIPDTKKALRNCVEKIKIGGHMYIYIYYNLDNRGFIFKSIFKISNFIRLIISSLPKFFKKIVCDIIAFLVYIPFVYLGIFFKTIGLKKLAKKTPLNYYQDKSIYIIRNDALDRFGTRLEQRFTKNEIIVMMNDSGLSNIIISNNMPYWHAVGKRTQ
jgi:ubiquinone/menaquinone biosynthesis C-methylase UbiE